MSDEVHIKFTRRSLGKQRWSNFNQYGWDAECSCGNWSIRHNGPKRETTAYARDHLRDVHNIRGIEARWAMGRA